MSTGNFVFASGKRNMMAGGGIDLLAHDIRLLLCSGSYVPDQSADTNLTAISGGDRLATSASLTTKTVSGDGIFNADSALFTSVSGSTPITQGILYKHTGTDATALLIARFEGRFASTLQSNTSAGATSIPVSTGQGGNFLTGNFLFYIGSEWFWCTSRSGDTITAIPGQFASTLAGHSSGDVIATPGYAGLPFTPTGGNIVWVWPTDAFKIFSIVG